MLLPAQTSPPPEVLVSSSRQKEITHSPKQHSFENLFPPTAEKGRGKYDLLYQYLVRKYKDDLEYYVFLFFV